MNWMGGLALLLFWLPVFGPLLAGFVGGLKAGSIRTAVVAVFLPALLTGLLAFAGVTYLTDWYGWGVLAGLGGVMISLPERRPLAGRRHRRRARRPAHPRLNTATPTGATDAREHPEHSSRPGSSSSPRARRVRLDQRPCRTTDSPCCSWGTA